MLHPTQIRRVSRLLYVLLTSGDILLKLSFFKNKGGFVCSVHIYLLHTDPKKPLFGCTYTELTLSLPECLIEFCRVILTFESVDEIL